MRDRVQIECVEGVAHLRLKRAEKIGRMASLALVASATVCLSLSAAAFERPPRNPFLADSVYPMGHGDSAQQDALPVAGPQDPGPALEANEIEYAHVGPAHFGAYTSSPYPGDPAR